MDMVGYGAGGLAVVVDWSLSGGVIVVDELDTCCSDYLWLPFACGPAQSGAGAFLNLKPSGPFLPGFIRAATEAQEAVRSASNGDRWAWFRPFGRLGTNSGTSSEGPEEDDNSGDEAGEGAGGFLGFSQPLGDGHSVAHTSQAPPGQQRKRRRLCEVVEGLKRMKQAKEKVVSSVSASHLGTVTQWPIPSRLHPGSRGSAGA